MVKKHEEIKPYVMTRVSPEVKYKIKKKLAQLDIDWQTVSKKWIDNWLKK